MRPVVLLFITLLGLNVAADGESFRQSALAVLSESLRARGPQLTGTLLQRIGERSSLPDSLVRRNVMILLDSLQTTWADTGSALHQRLSEAHEDKADRFMRGLIEVARKACAGPASYNVTTVIERTAGKARLSSEDGIALLLRATEAGGGEHSAPVDMPGILLQGSSDYRVEESSFAGMLVTEEDIRQQTRFRDLHVRLGPALAQRLDQLPSVRWAITKTNPRLQHDVVLHFVIDEFDSRPSPRDVVLMAAVRLALSTPDGTRLQAGRIEYAYDYWLEPDEEVRSQRRLDTFIERLAAAVAEETRGYLETLAEAGR